MQYMVLIYNEPELLDSLPDEEKNGLLRECFAHTDALEREGRLLEARMLADVSTGRSLRHTNGRMTMLDGPFAEAKEVLGGFNLIEAENMEEAVRIASGFPWSRTGRVEVRPVQNLAEVRRRVEGVATESAGATARGRD